MQTILYITPSVELLGARISLIQLLSYLDRDRFRPVVIVPRHGPLVGKLRDLNVDTRIIKFGNWRKVKCWPGIPAALYNMTEVAREVNAALWHSNEFWSFPFASLSAQRLNLPTICHFRCSRLPAQLPSWKLRSYRVHKADRILAVSRAQFQLFRKMKDVNGKFTVIHNGLDVALFNGNNREKFRKECGVSDDERLVGMIGAVSEYKGVDDFLHAAAQMCRRIKGLKFVIVGPDTGKPKGFTGRMKQLAAELEISDKVIFTGFRNDIADIMTALDLLMTPSRVEAFGRVIIESLASGTPIVAYRVGGIPEIISDPEVGILVEPGNTAHLAEEAVKLLLDTDRREKMIRAGYAHICNHFTIQAHVKKIEEVYKTLLNSKNQRPES